jgi:hypothetical protein
VFEINCNRRRIRIALALAGTAATLGTTAAPAFALNPQPLPPFQVPPAHYINPQPLPPIDLGSLNPQPLPPIVW